MATKGAKHAIPADNTSIEGPIAAESMSVNTDKHLGGHTDYHGIDTTQVQPGADPVYEAKIAILNEALIDIGMGPFQWKIFATTGFGWFIDQVCGLGTPLLWQLTSYGQRGHGR